MMGCAKNLDLISAYSHKSKDKFIKEVKMVITGNQDLRVGVFWGCGWLLLHWLSAGEAGPNSEYSTIFIVCQMNSM